MEEQRTRIIESIGLALYVLSIAHKCLIYEFNKIGFFCYFSPLHSLSVQVHYISMMIAIFIFLYELTIACSTPCFLKIDAHT